MRGPISTWTDRLRDPATITATIAASVVATITAGLFAVTGDITATGSITSSAGNLAATVGDVTAGDDVIGQDLTLTHNAIAAAQTAGITIQNSTAALVGAQVQSSPMVYEIGAGWDIDGAVSVPVISGQQLLPIAGNTVTSAWVWYTCSAVGTCTEKGRLASNGELTLVGDVAAAGGYRQTSSKFTSATLTANQTGIEFTTRPYPNVAFAGSIVGIACSFSGNQSAGTTTVNVGYNNATAQTSSLVSCAKAGAFTAGYTFGCTWAKDAYPFTANSLLWLTWTTSADGAWSGSATISCNFVWES